MNAARPIGDKDAASLGGDGKRQPIRPPWQTHAIGHGIGKDRAHERFIKKKPIEAPFK